MSEQTQDVVNQLEQRVEELTAANRQLRRQASLLDVTVKLNQVIATTPDVSSLSKRIVRVTKELLELHHISIFLIDPTGSWIVLSQAAGRASRKMNRDGLRLPVEGESCLSWVTKNQEPYLSYPSDLTGKKSRALSVKHNLLPKAQSELTLPLVSAGEPVGVLDLQSTRKRAFDQEDVVLFQALADQIALAIERAQRLARTMLDRDRTALLYDVGISLGPDLDIETILDRAVELTDRLGATFGEAKLLTAGDKTYFRSSVTERNKIDRDRQDELVRSALENGLEAQVLTSLQPVLQPDATHGEDWHLWQDEQPIGSIMCAPVVDDQDRFQGTLAFVHAEPFHFSEIDLPLLAAIASQISTALGNRLFVSELRSGLRETHLMLDISRSLSGAGSLTEVYEALEQSVLATGANRCTLYICDELDNNNLPTYGQIVFVGDSSLPTKSKLLNYRFPLAKYEILDELVYAQETLVIKDVSSDERLSSQEQELLRQFDSRSLVINPLVIRGHVIGFLSIEHRNQREFTDRELALYRTLCNQTTAALDHARQIQRTREALAETQTLYRAGRVLAGAKDFEDILQEALIEFVYSFNLDQGGITMLTSDKQFGQLRAYVEKGQLQEFEKLRFPIRDNIVYQELLLSGQPFTSYDVANDIRLVEFRSFNRDKSIKSTLQAPMIIRGETIGWIGVDAVDEHREFGQKDIDLARAMADQIAIAIQNHRLLEQTERRAEQLKAVAVVGEAVTGLLELDEVLKITVDLIRDRFGYYHVSIFLLDDRQEWAVVRASTGDVGKIMVERPHRLGVGSNSIVGFVTANSTPRIALDVGKDAVHFNNPLLPDTRSEMALPLSSRGVVIGALDVQSVQANAFTDDDIETLQVMADQITTAIENARLFEQTQRRLREQALLYSIGTKISGTLKLQETTDILVSETADALDCAQCVLSLFEENQFARVLSEYVKEGAQFSRGRDTLTDVTEFTSWTKILSTKQEFILHIDDSGSESWEYRYLKDHGGSGLVVVPILLRNDVIGVLEVYDDKAGRRFKYQDVVLLDSIALLAANAIENARLYETAHESQTFMKAIIEQIPDPIFIKDREHKWIVVNTAFSEGILGQSEDLILGATDYDFLPKEQADWLWKYDNRMFETGDIQETEEEITDFSGSQRILYTRKIPLNLSSEADKPEYLIGIINDITDRKQRESERERLIEETSKTLQRTQTLYRISDTLATADEQQPTFEAVLGQYLQLLKLKQGRITRPSMPMSPRPPTKTASSSHQHWSFRLKKTKYSNICSTSRLPFSFRIPRETSSPRHARMYVVGLNLPGCCLFR
jgi:PAS domain S-box-containing protein